MSVSEGPPRLSPDQLITIKLFEIADRLADQAAEGHLTSGTTSVGTDVKEIVGAMLSISFHSDGPNDVYIWTQEASTRKPWMVGDAPLKSGEDLSIDFKAKTGSVVHLRCETGTCTLRYWKLV